MGTHPCPVLSSRECEQRPKDQGRKQLPVPDQSTERPWVEPLSFSETGIYQSPFWVLGKQQTDKTVPALLMLIV